MKIISADQAAALIEDGQTLLVGGSGGGHAVPDRLLESIGSRFVSTGYPRRITAIHPVGLGDGRGRGAGHLAHDGLLKRVVCGTLVDAPAVAELARQDRLEAYTLPQGALSQLVREIAAGRPGLFSQVGLHTFVDPEQAGGRQSPSAVEDLVERVELKGRTWLFYKPFSIDVALIRGTCADEAGNLTMDREPIYGEMLSIAQATRRCGGTVIAQVAQIAKRGTLPARAVKVPGFLVDYVVLDPDAPQTYETKFDPAYAGLIRRPWSQVQPAVLAPEKVIARRAAMELHRGAICNIGSGVMTGIGRVAAEEGIIDDVVLTNEQGLIGGMPASGFDSGASTNFDCMVDQPYQFDFYDGGGLDVAFLSFAEVDPHGSVNISRFAGGRIVGVGGFINISQNAKHVVFGGFFTAAGLQAAVTDGELDIRREGRVKKFRSELEQTSYSGPFAEQEGRRATYVTERAVFKRRGGRLVLTEIAPGVDLQRDVLDQMDFEPVVSESLTLMDPRLFRDSPMNVALAADAIADEDAVHVS
jgi:propionate CoA-transferase